MGLGMRLMIRLYLQVFAASDDDLSETSVQSNRRPTSVCYPGVKLSRGLSYFYCVSQGGAARPAGEDDDRKLRCFVQMKVYSNWCAPVDNDFIVGDDGQPLRQKKGDGYTSEPYVDLCGCGV